MEFIFDIKTGDFTNAGKASSKLKKMLKQLNIGAKTIKRIVVAIYEAEVNIVAHSFGGKLNAVIDKNSIQVIVKDTGPGIKDINKALKEGYSTASKEVREMGFGAGMGLPNIIRNADEFDIESEPGVGTTLTFKNYFS